MPTPGEIADDLERMLRDGVIFGRRDVGKLCFLSLILGSCGGIVTGAFLAMLIIKFGMIGR